jgi:hypothetical protein
MWSILKGTSRALILLTNMLIKWGVGYEVKEKHKVSHLFYMDGLELFSKDESKFSNHCQNIY